MKLEDAKNSHPNILMSESCMHCKPASVLLSFPLFQHNNSAIFFKIWKYSGGEEIWWISHVLLFTDHTLNFKSRQLHLLVNTKHFINACFLFIYVNPVGLQILLLQVFKSTWWGKGWGEKDSQVHRKVWFANCMISENELICIGYVVCVLVHSRLV